MKDEAKAGLHDQDNIAATPQAVSYASLSSQAQARAQRAYARIAGDEGLTGSLTDDAASALLAWARQEVTRLAARTEAMDDAEAEAWLAARLSALRRRLREVVRRSTRAECPERAIRAQLLDADPAVDAGGEPPTTLARTQDETDPTR